MISCKHEKHKLGEKRREDRGQQRKTVVCCEYEFNSFVFSENLIIKKKMENNNNKRKKILSKGT